MCQPYCWYLLLFDTQAGKRKTDRISLSNSLLTFSSDDTLQQYNPTLSLTHTYTHKHKQQSGMIDADLCLLLQEVCMHVCVCVCARLLFCLRLSCVESFSQL